MTYVINLFGGPGIGKSTTAAGLFYLMKTHNIKCELVTEFAKELEYQGDLKGYCQHSILVEQNKRLKRIVNSQSGKVDFVITDSPLLLGKVYGDKDCALAIDQHFARYNNLNFLLSREKPYHRYGRSQTENEAIELDKKIAKLLEGHLFAFIEGGHNAHNQIFLFLKMSGYFND